jgi:hypothetical protein
MAKFYYGTEMSLATGATVDPETSAYSRAYAALDAGRPATSGLRAGSVWAAMSIKDATAIAAIRSYVRSTPKPHSLIRVYRVELVPFHAAPLAILAELQSRLATGTPFHPLVREYWEPTGVWHLMEALAPTLTVMEVVTPATEADIHTRRWLHYNRDCKRAAAFEPTIRQRLQDLLYR